MQGRKPGPEIAGPGNSMYTVLYGICAGGANDRQGTPKMEAGMLSSQGAQYLAIDRPIQ